MTEKTAPTFNVDIHMAGDINAEGLIIQRYAAETGLCVTLSPQSFIYSGGREEGFRVGFINYPRFPKARMLERKIASARVKCPECGGMLHGRLVGRKNHMRFWCDGTCKRQMME